MIVTEEEAKTKWCPETLIGGGASADTSQANRWVQSNADGGSVVAGASCIGSACMMWRWHFDGLGDYPPNTKGYCGKAGGW